MDSPELLSLSKESPGQKDGVTGGRNYCCDLDLLTWVRQGYMLVRSKPGFAIQACYGIAAKCLMTL